MKILARRYTLYYIDTQIRMAIHLFQIKIHTVDAYKTAFKK